METDVAVLAERRAKMARLRSEHFVAGRDVTSAPRVTSVDEFSQVRDGRENVDQDLLNMTKTMLFIINFLRSMERQKEKLRRA